MTEIMTEDKCLYVSNRGFARRCDYFPKTIDSDSKGFNWANYEKPNGGLGEINKPIVKIYVITTQLKGFIIKMLPILQKINQKFILITGASVIGVPCEITKICGERNIKKLFNSPLLLRWYCQNYDSHKRNDKIHLIPLGIDYHTLSSNKKIYWGKNKSAKEQDLELQELAKEAPKFSEKKNLAFANYHFVNINRHNNDRKQATSAIAKNARDIVFFTKKKVDRTTLFKLTGVFKFNISPLGQGYDCHRTWETLILGGIPVIRKSPISPLFEGLPVVELNNWNEWNKNKMNESIKKYEEYFAENQDQEWREKLTLDYWWNKIETFEANFTETKA
jgi:hypothetical protein